eukprot:TRINITY_DN2305_c0_g1_i10.p1 TRINITY_DN2305_c0_g1~~TRINITY_DN2305_c0_g1_i10.p1  ORF type:complete len:159 (-),score=27.70 TRINITY_DN2305_c0_g1_i10:837-1313(-)
MDVPLSVPLKFRVKINPSLCKIETVEIPPASTAGRAKKLIEQALGIANPDPDSVLVMLPSTLHEGCILPDEKLMGDLYMDVENDMSDVIMSIYSYPAFVEVVWADSGKGTAKEYKKRTLLLDKSLELNLYKDLFWELLDRGKKKEDLVIRQLSSNEGP